jgi:beta-glucanase (GH16 family)
MAASVNAKDFSGAELYTLDEMTYGKFEARMKMAAASGTVSSMFLYQNGSEQSSAERWVEVDIEVLGKNPGSFQSNIITGKAGAQKTSEKHHTVSPAADQGFHTYGIEWTPNYVRWTVDGNEVRKTEKGVNDPKDQVANLIGTQGLRFNIWSSESADWVGQFDESKLPLFQFINWVKVYKYTPGQGEGGSDFTLDWVDDFDTFDSGRWGKGNWTFDGNRVDLTPNNIYSKDGMLILALTRKGQESFNGQVPQDDQPGPTSSSSSEQQISSSSATESIHQVRVQAPSKEIRGKVNAKGARVNETRANDPRNRYRVNFTF